jgi:hypothetical protein
MRKNSRNSANRRPSHRSNLSAGSDRISVASGASAAAVARFVHRNLPTFGTVDHSVTGAYPCVKIECVGGTFVFFETGPDSSVVSLYGGPMEDPGSWGAWALGLPEWPHCLLCIDDLKRIADSGKDGHVRIQPILAAQAGLVVATFPTAENGLLN